MPERLRVALATVREHLGKLGPTQKLLIGSLAVILAMTLFVVAQYAGRPAFVELLPGATASEASRAEATLVSVGVPAEIRQGKLMVPAGDQHRAMAHLAERRALPADGEQILYANLSERQSWQNSRRQNEQLFLIATQNELSRMIEKLRGVRRAEVQLDVPEASGIGRVVRTPTASVVVDPESAGLNQAMVDAIAELVAWSRAGLDVRNVRVIDASTGRSRRPSDPDEVIPGTYLEHASRVETLTREKLLDLLSYIPGVQVAVTAQVDVTRVARETRSYLPEGDGTLNLAQRERNQAESQSRRATSAEPGMRSNQAAEINTGGSGAGTAYERSDDEVEFTAFPGQQFERVTDPRGMPTRVAVSINVPRSYVAGLLNGTRGAGAEGEAEEPPSVEALEEAFERVEPSIRQAVLPHILALSVGEAAEEAATQLAVAMVPTDFVMGVPGTSRAGGLLGMLAGEGGGLGGGVGIGPGGLISQGVLLALASFAVVMMLMMVRKAAKRVELPSAAELVGVPPTLETNSDLVGEAEEGDTPMTGIEVGDDEARQVKMLEQVSEMVRSEPQVAAKLLNRWVQVDDY